MVIFDNIGFERRCLRWLKSRVTLPRLLHLVVVIGSSELSSVSAQVAQARNMSIGEHRHCCVTKYKD